MYNFIFNICMHFNNISNRLPCAFYFYVFAITQLSFTIFMTLILKLRFKWQQVALFPEQNRFDVSILQAINIVRIFMLSL